MKQPESILLEIETPADTSERLLFYFITFFTGLSYVLMTSKWGYSVSESSQLSTTLGVLGVNSMQVATGKALLGIVGGALLLWPSPASCRYRVAPLFFFTGYLLCCFSSVIWSVDSELTGRRLLVLLIYLIGILGTSRHLSTRQLLDSALIVSLILVILAFTSEVTHGTFTPLDGNYRFAGTMHPNSQGAICALLVLSAYCGLRETGSNRGIYLTALVIGILFLFLTKSRSSILGCLIAFYLTSFWKSSLRAKQLLILIPSFFICMTILTVSLVAPDFLKDLDGLINIGRDLDTSDVVSLNGRVPLWVFLKDYILQKSLLGYGYHAFWTSDMMASFADYSITWAESAHSIIIDVLLQLGLAGGLLYGLSFVSVFYWIIKDCTVNGSADKLFTFAITIYALIFGLLESNFIEPKSFGAFVISVALFNCCIIKEKVTNY